MLLRLIFEFNKRFFTITAGLHGITPDTANRFKEAISENKTRLSREIRAS